MSQEDLESKIKISEQIVYKNDFSLLKQIKEGMKLKFFINDDHCCSFVVNKAHYLQGGGINSFVFKDSNEWTQITVNHIFGCLMDPRFSSSPKYEMTAYIRNVKVEDLEFFVVCKNL
jgi:hypothetical protein